MILLLASLAEFLQFLKIVMWISIPLFVVSTLIVVFIHYRRKKSAALTVAPEAGYAMAFASENQPADVSFFRHQVFNSREQYELLQGELKKIKLSFQSGKEGFPDGQEEAKGSWQRQIRHFELKMQQVQQSVEYLEKTAGSQEDYSDRDKEVKRLQSVIEQLNREIALLRQQQESKDQEVQKLDRMVREMQEAARQAGTDARDLHLSQQEKMEERDRERFEENTRLTEQVKQLHEECRRLEAENSELQQSIGEIRSTQLLSSKNNGEEYAHQGRMPETEQDLRSRLVEAASLKEMLEDRNAQLQLLQQQLEQKTRMNHQLDQQMEELRKENGFLTEDNQWKGEETQRQQQLIEEGSAENRLLKQQLLDAEDSLSIAGNEQRQLRQRLSEYEEEMNRSVKVITQLENQLSESGDQLKQYHALCLEIQKRVSPLLSAGTDHSTPQQVGSNGVLIAN